MRRGGVASGGELPRAAAVAVGSEEQLREEVEAIAAQLQPSVDWTQRVEALVRLEGLALGGAAQFVAFAECLAAARDPLLGQVGGGCAAKVVCWPQQAGGRRGGLPMPQMLPGGAEAACFWLACVAAGAGAPVSRLAASVPCVCGAG